MLLPCTSLDWVYLLTSRCRESSSYVYRHISRSSGWWLLIFIYNPFSSQPCRRRVNLSPEIWRSPKKNTSHQTWTSKTITGVSGCWLLSTRLGAGQIKHALCTSPCYNMPGEIKRVNIKEESLGYFPFWRSLAFCCIARAGDRFIYWLANL